MHLTKITVAAMLFTMGCGKHPGAAYTALDTTGSGGDAAALLDEAEKLWGDRHTEESLVSAIGKYEAAIAADPTNRDVLVRLTRGWYLYGDAFADDKAVKIERWGTAIEWGARCLAANAEFANQIADGAKEKDAVSTTTKDDVPCLYWTATALGKWGKAQGLAKTLTHLPTVKAYVTRADELDPQYFHYGPARYWGAYYSVLPSFAGQDLEKSAAYFRESLDGAPNYLATRGLRAEHLAVKTQDPALFESDLEWIIAFNAASEPGLVPENTIEQAKATRLLAKMEELFDKKTLEAYRATKPAKVETVPAEPAVVEPTAEEPAAEAPVTEEAAAVEGEAAVDGEAATEEATTDGEAAAAETAPAEGETATEEAAPAAE